jgi:hypothetical protein
MPSSTFVLEGVNFTEENGDPKCCFLTEGALQLLAINLTHSEFAGGFHVFSA